MSTVIMEERFKAEERKEILGEEWRKVSKIFDRYISHIFTYFHIHSQTFRKI